MTPGSPSTHAPLALQGNCTLSDRSDPHGEFAGKNCLIQLEPLERVALQVGDCVQLESKGIPWMFGHAFLC